MYIYCTLYVKCLLTVRYMYIHVYDWTRNWGIRKAMIYMYNVDQTHL